MTRLTLASALLIGTAGSAQAFNPQPEPPAFGMAGLGWQQFAALNAVLTTPVDPAHPGCRVLLAFVDARGQAFRDRAGNEIKRSLVLRGNVAGSLTLRSADIMSEGEQRKPIRALVTDGPDDGTPTECGGMVATFEIIAPNGWTTVFESLAVPPRDPPPPDPR